MTKISIRPQELEVLFGFSSDPLGFVLAAFPWGEGILRDDYPEDWQLKWLADLTNDLQNGMGMENWITRFATSSGHGVGKSALVAWVIIWFILCHHEAKGVVTANTENQLTTKTWPEVVKWTQLCLFRHLVDLQATSIKSIWNPQNCRVDRTPWSEKTTEAFAGLHSKWVLAIFDEASAIPDVIWETTEGAMNVGICIWAVFGNPTRRNGRFRACFDQFSHRWNNRTVSALTVRRGNKRLLEEWVNDYGEESNFVKIRVLGLFPEAAGNQLIPDDLIAEARKRSYKAPPDVKKITGVDVARFGDDRSVIYTRQGFGYAHLPVILVKLDTNMVVHELLYIVERHGPDGVIVDATATGVIDLTKSHDIRVIEGNFGLNTTPNKMYSNMRAWMYFQLRDWLKKGGAIPDDDTLAQELAAQTYTYDRRGERIILSPKEDIKAELGRSPDLADALALTFFQDVSRGYAKAHTRPGGTRIIREYDPLDA